MSFVFCFFLFFLSRCVLCELCGKLFPAAHWRIHTGIDQGDTANTVEMNLALALQSYSGVKDVEFTTVWEQGHTMAERTGNATDNFIAWVTGVVKP